jgi:hypothetical protein
LPQANCIPAFYLKYAYDAQTIKDFDLGVLDIGELALNLVLNFTGLGSAVEVGYLAEISGIAEANTLVESTPVLTWDNFVGLNKTVMFTAGSFKALTDYALAQSHNDDPNVKAILQSLDNFLGAITLGTMGIDLTAQLITAGLAKQIDIQSINLSEEDALPDDAKKTLIIFL